MTIEHLLFVLMAVAMAGGFFVYMIRISSTSLSSAEGAVIYPEEQPQILELKCYTDHGYLFVESGGLEGTINYRLEDFNGTIVKDSSVDVNISDYGAVYFGSLMEKGKNYMLRIYTPYWSISDSCTANVHDDAVMYLAFDEDSGTTAEDFAGDNDGTLSGYNDGTVNGANWTTGYSGSALISSICFLMALFMALSSGFGVKKKAGMTRPLVMVIGPWPGA